MAIRGDRTGELFGIDTKGHSTTKTCVTCNKTLEVGQLFFCKKCLAELTILSHEDPKDYYKRIEGYGKR